MKRCPTCQRTYEEDAPDYCPTDGMRLVRETAAGQDPERTVLSSGLRVPEPVLPERPRPQQPPPPPAPSIPEPTPAQPPYYASGDAASQPFQPQPQPPVTQQQPPPPPAPQFAPQGWSSQPPPQAAQPWANPYQNPAYQNPGPTTPLIPLPNLGRNEALAIAGLVTGCCAVTIMAMLVARSLGAVLNLMLVLSILGLGLGVTALLLALQKPARFGGIPLAIAGLATGTAALVYYFTL